MRVGFVLKVIVQLTQTVNKNTPVVGSEESNAISVFQVRYEHFLLDRYNVLYLSLPSHEEIESSIITFLNEVNTLMHLSCFCLDKALLDSSQYVIIHYVAKARTDTLSRSLHPNINHVFSLFWYNLKIIYR
jgi:hypothetical protein